LQWEILKLKCLDADVLPAHSGICCCWDTQTKLCQHPFNVAATSASLWSSYSCEGQSVRHGGDGSIEMAKKLPKNVVIDLLAKLEVGSACSLCDVSNLISRCYFDVHLLSISFSLLFGCNHMSLMCTAGCVMSWIHWVVSDGLPCRLITPT